MVNLAKLKREMKKVREASLGEVVMFAGPGMHVSWDQEYGLPEFKAVLGIYNGIDRTGYCESVSGKTRVYATLISQFNVGLMMLDLPSRPIHGVEIQKKLCVPMMYEIPPNFLGVLSLGEDDVAYVGPKDVADVLHTECQGKFDEFFRNYVELHRKLN